MKLIIAGGRDFADDERSDNPTYYYDLLCQAMIDSNGATKATEIVCGKARGADSLGERWAREKGIALKEFPANWDLNGKKAGILRNIEMGDYADCLIAFWDGKSRGTAHMIQYMRAIGKHVYVVRY